jgi:Ca2+-binding EF-hand superfamily protein
MKKGPNTKSPPLSPKGVGKSEKSEKGTEKPHEKIEKVEIEGSFMDINSRNINSPKKNQFSVSNRNPPKSLVKTVRDTQLADPKLTSVPALPDGKPVTISTRALLPFYKLDDVKRFCDIFAEADEDFCGDLDMAEWVHLFEKLNKNVSAQDARLIFMQIDKNGSGSVSLSELIPVVFSKATRAQIKMIVAYAGSILIRDKTEDLEQVNVSDIEQLFDAYDEDAIGFVIIGHIKDRVKHYFNLPEPIIYAFLLDIEHIDDDEMLNRVEFHRLLKPFITQVVMK